MYNKHVSDIFDGRMYENDNLLSKLLALNDSIDDAVNRLSSGNTP